MGKEHCDDSCSWISPIGCDILSHEEIEKELDKTLKYNPILTYNSYIANLKEKHPRLYGLVKKSGFIPFRKIL